ncbi:DUF4249 domain-containing protein [Desertivirga brevis]|uniref:DUF4249 domain-containing protein n=1 Tax=Desertivirga brevis TaxID=2810310 RepID=UPI001A966E49|nr:DUF4249 domain-containing protein [Pedobacter sp. SYSU D00873]
MRLIQTFFVLFALLFFSACEKVIDIELKGSDPLLVIEGVINNRTDTQSVRITSSVPIGESNRFPGVSGATVTVKDQDGITYAFRERAPGIYSSRRMRGIPGRTYSLSILYNRKSYTAQSRMPSQVTIDSIGFQSTTIFNNSRTSLQLIFRDPPQIKNYYRFVLSVNEVKTSSIFVYSDDFTDGKQVTRDLFDVDVDLKSGDKVAVEMHCIDPVIYRYWFGLDQNRSRGGASVTPANPVSNISNGALGYFSAQTQQTEQLYVPFL